MKISTKNMHASIQEICTAVVDSSYSENKVFGGEIEGVNIPLALATFKITDLVEHYFSDKAIEERDKSVRKTVKELRSKKHVLGESLSSDKNQFEKPIDSLFDESDVGNADTDFISVYDRFGKFISNPLEKGKKHEVYAQNIGGYSLMLMLSIYNDKDYHNFKIDTSISRTEYSINISPFIVDLKLLNAYMDTANCSNEFGAILTYFVYSIRNSLPDYMLDKKNIPYIELSVISSLIHKSTFDNIMLSSGLLNLGIDAYTKTIKPISVEDKKLSLDEQVYLVTGLDNYITGKYKDDSSARKLWDSIIRQFRLSIFGTVSNGIRTMKKLEKLNLDINSELPAFISYIKTVPVTALNIIKITQKGTDTANDFYLGRINSMSIEVIADGKQLNDFGHDINSIILRSNYAGYSNPLSIYYNSGINFEGIEICSTLSNETEAECRVTSWVIPERLHPKDNCVSEVFNEINLKSKEISTYLSVREFLYRAIKNNCSLEKAVEIGYDYSDKCEKMYLAKYQVDDESIYRYLNALKDMIIIAAITDVFNMANIELKKVLLVRGKDYSDSFKAKYI